MTVQSAAEDSARQHEPKELESTASFYTAGKLDPVVLLHPRLRRRSQRRARRQIVKEKRERQQQLVNLFITGKFEQEPKNVAGLKR